MTALDRVPVEPALVERFRRDVARVRPLERGERIALAVSGGPDSMAMLALAAAAFPGAVLAATVDHRLRAEAADEAQMVAEWCGRHAIPHTTLTIDDAIGSSNVQALARDRRYALLLEWATEAGAACLATAHHADDQAETFLMRAARGSGVAGLGGIRACQRIGAIDLIRPLLDWRVAELRALAVARALPFVDDPSNGDAHYDRTRFRALLRAAPWLDPVQIAHAAAHAAEADATLRAVEAWLWETRTVRPANRHSGLVAGSTATREGTVLELKLDTSALPRELKRRLCRRAIHAVRAAQGLMRPAFTDSTNIEPLLDALEAGDTATQGGVMVSAHAQSWHFVPQPPRRAL
jgi:tRNA(Ile)-lysidine synthase